MKNTPVFLGKAGLQQRVLPSYRVPFFDELAGRCAQGLSLFSGDPRPDEAILSGASLSTAAYQKARNLHLFREGAYLCIQPGILDWLKAWDPEVLILEANPRYLSNRAAIRWMHARRRPVLGWGLGAPRLKGFLSLPRDRLRRSYLQRLDAIITYSSLGAETYQAMDIPEDRIFTAYNAVASKPGPAAVRPPLGDRPVEILFVGRLQDRKRIDILLRACALQAQPLRLTIVGEGPSRQALELLAGEVLPGTWFTGALEGEPLKKLFQESHLFVLPGTGGLAIQEAMSYALPVIVAEGDGTQRDLVTPENGWLIPPGNLDALSRILAEALSDKERLVAMGSHSRQLALERFNIESMADTFIEAMNTVVGEYL
ncbi:MAG: glycosyltransferase family 4 protein [Anaerolineales bacterium]|nr:glycosyltransferase family 4 protein [Anaerolineales bacterium]